MSDDATVTDAPETEEVEEATDPPDFYDLDVAVAEVVERYGGAQEALAAYQEERDKMAAEAGVHPEQLPEDRREFLLRRKLEIAGAQAKRRAAEVSAVESRRSTRAVNQELADVQARRNRAAVKDTAKADAAAEKASPKPTHGDPDAEKDAEEQRAKVAETQEKRDTEVAAEKVEHDAKVERQRQADADADKSNPKVVTDKNLTPENLDGLNVGALKALARKKGLEVTRADGDGDPVRADYIAALTG